MSTLLELRDVHARYGSLRALHGIDLQVAEGETVALLGANGAGKTTTLRCVSGLVTTTGEIAYDGRRLSGHTPEEVARLGVAHVPQGRGTFTGLNVEDNLRVGAITRSGRGVGAEIARWYETFPRLGERRRQLAGSLSGGEQQMLAIARALMMRPKLLLLDEPSLGLAPLVVADLFAALVEIRRSTGTAVLVVEQNARLALGFADRAYVVEAGHIVLSGEADRLAGEDRIREAYLGG
ncbi:ABC transporter ATP-binding protein [Nonomuraea purpurea]|uniref:ABC transporter ATP-binding protein n=1 Tax=Nonomuraea purpurea TaxID=1849276 RepID=A0ABV8G339_9ACTN